jgi:hypothetical protein
MSPLVEEIVSLENDADSMLAKARAEAQELDKSATAEMETYHRKLAEDMEGKVSAFQRGMGEKLEVSLAEAKQKLARDLDAIDQIADNVLKVHIDQIVDKAGDL